MKVTRRDFVRQSAAATAAAVAGVPLPGAAQGIVTDASLTRMKWSKAPCRFCGTGCGVNVAVKDGRVVKGVNFVDLVDAPTRERGR